MITAIQLLDGHIFSLCIWRTQKTAAFLQGLNGGRLDVVRQHQFDGTVRQCCGNFAINHQIKHFQHACGVTLKYANLHICKSLINVSFNTFVYLFLRGVIKEIVFNLFNLFWNIAKSSMNNMSTRNCVHFTIGYAESRLANAPDHLLGLGELLRR